MGAIPDREGGNFLTQKLDQRRGQFQRPFTLIYGWTNHGGPVSCGRKKPDTAVGVQALGKVSFDILYSIFIAIYFSRLGMIPDIIDMKKL